jgi:hypothetical protein
MSGKRAKQSNKRKFVPPDNDGYTCTKPLIHELKHTELKEGEEAPKFSKIFNIDEIEKFGPYFHLPNSLEATPATLCELYWPDHLIQTFCDCTNAYARERLPRNKRKRVGKAEMLRFLASIYYMGLVQLPAKEDYIGTEGSSVWPNHHAIQLDRPMFEYIWRNFHMTATERFQMTKRKKKTMMKILNKLNITILKRRRKKNNNQIQQQIQRLHHLGIQKHQN